MTANFDTLFPTLNTVSCHGTIREHAEDFVVIEHHEMTFTESGEHLWFNIKKTNCNTAWVATQLASACKVPARQVGFAGLKDRHAITQQWFSVQLPKIADLKQIKNKLPDGIEIIDHHWHHRKIKSGQLKHNEFRLRIRNIVGDQAMIEKNVELVIDHGAPNYFGPQRFGYALNNIKQAKDWFTGKTKVNNKKLRGLLISTARSHIFNAILAHRIRLKLWHQVIPGDIIQLAHSHSWFPAADASTSELANRLRAFDLHITAALWGENDVQSSDESAALETEIAKDFHEYLTGFEIHRVKQDRRAIRVRPFDLSYQWIGSDDSQLQISFKLPPGAYATCILREILTC